MSSKLGKILSITRRLGPSVLTLPWTVIRYRTIAFLHPISRTQGNVSFAKFAELGFGSVVKSGHFPISIGEYTQINENCVISGNVTIGARCLIAPSVTIAVGTHKFGRGVSPRFSGAQGAEQFLVIEDDVWIASGALLIGNIRIGAGSVISAGAVVDKDIPPQTLVRRAAGQSTIDPLR